MGNSPSAANLTENEKALVSLWGECLSVLDAMIKKQMDVFVRTVKYGAMDRIIITAGKDARLSGYDDKVFICWRRMMDCYSRAADLYLERRADISTVSIATLLNGVYEFLAERVSQFAGRWPEMEDNPISAEKVKIISAGVAYFLLGFDDMEKDYRENESLRLMEILRDIAVSADDASSVQETYQNFEKQIKTNLAKFFLEKSYDEYAKCVESCVTSLNDGANRQVAMHFYSLLESEAYVHNTIFKARLMALESEIARDAGNSQEQWLAKEFLSILREGCAVFDAQASEIIKEFSVEAAHPKRLRIESIAEYEQAFYEMFSNTVIIARRDYQEAIKMGFEAFEKIEEALSSDFDFFREKIQDACSSRVMGDPNAIGSQDFAKTLTEAALREQTMAEEIAAIFAKQISFYAERYLEYEKLPENGIMKGINETLMIKVESLEENTAAFLEKAAKIAQAASKATARLFPEEANELLQAMPRAFRQAFRSAPESSEELSEAFRSFYGKCAVADAMAPYRKRLSDEYDRHQAILSKAITSFRKENILFEISTFEEILQYSVSRLRESEVCGVKDYVQFIDESTLEIERLLESHGISLIKPKPHDMFNGKEHEVLVVEKNESFGKGEIIKLMTSGYRQEEFILLRANVIAAR
ncbi:MAG: nucleotide exchange factor GrpE [Clostridiales bacterium]|jgi:molecular chaperone GrpE (heat shock protein)|nr:nucleotide exchange factor GrpE [Clostridiales bacterium]